MHQIKQFLRQHARWALFLGIFTLFFTTSLLSLDPDFGWHLRSGQYFLAHGIPAFDIFTYTATDFPWVNHEWLSDCIVALVHGLGGYPLLAVLYAAMWTGTVAIMGRGVHPIFIIVGVFAIIPFAGVRALTWSVLALALLVVILRQKNKKWRLVIPLLFLVWANLHGSFLIGIAYGGWVVIKERSWRLFALGVVSLALTFVNPYGIELYTEVFRTALDTDLHAAVEEWARFAIPLVALPFVFTWGGLTINRARTKWKEYVRFDTLLFLLSINSVRMLPLFVLFALQPLQESATAIVQAVPLKARKRLIRLAHRSGLVLIVVTAALMLYGGVSSGTSGNPAYPTRAVTYLSEHPCEGNLFNAYNFGGFIIGSLPDQKVYIDGRMPSWKDQQGESYMKRHTAVLSDESIRNEEIKRYNITCALIYTNTPMARELKAAGWDAVIEDGTSSLLVAPKR